MARPALERTAAGFWSTVVTAVAVLIAAASVTFFAQLAVPATARPRS